MSSMPPPPPMPSAATVQGEAAGLFAALFDFSFTKFATPKIVKVFYAIAVVAAGLYTLFAVFAAFRLHAVLGVVALLLAPVLAFFILAMMRMTLEMYVATIRMSEDIHKRLPSA